MASPLAATAAGVPTSVPALGVQGGGDELAFRRSGLGLVVEIGVGRDGGLRRGRLRFQVGDDLLEERDEPLDGLFHARQLFQNQRVPICGHNERGAWRRLHVRPPCCA